MHVIHTSLCKYLSCPFLYYCNRATSQQNVSGTINFPALSSDMSCPCPSSVHWQFRLLFCICFQSSQPSHLFEVRKCMDILMNLPQQILLLLFNVISSELSGNPESASLLSQRCHWQQYCSTTTALQRNKNSPCLHFHLLKATGMNASDQGSEKVLVTVLTKELIWFVTLTDPESRLR